jgi:hypothetical protein
VPPVCSNCGANDFVWANDLRTGGSLSAGTLSLRPRGELSIGTRICKACGHADLFLKDPAILKSPHTWRPGEFVPIPSTPSAHHHGHKTEDAPTESPMPSPPTPPGPIVPGNPGPSLTPPPPPPPAPPPSGASEEPMLPPPPDESTAGTPATSGESAAKRPRRKKAKGTESPTP